MNIERYLPMKFRHWWGERTATKKLRRERVDLNDPEYLKMVSGYMDYLEGIADEKAYALTKRIERKARHLYLPIPNYPRDWKTGDENWRWSVLSQPVLTETAVSKLRTTIRTETAGRREHFIAWVPAVTGLVAAFTGLLAICLALVTIKCSQSDPTSDPTAKSSPREAAATISQSSRDSVTSLPAPP